MRISGRDKPFSNRDLDTIVHSSYSKWAKVKKFKVPTTPCDCEFSMALEDHHEVETKYLIRLCRQLARELLYWKHQ